MSSTSPTTTCDVRSTTGILDTLKELVIEITQLKTPAAEIPDTANLFNDCGVDSTSLLDLVLAIEERFNITIDERELDIQLFQDLSVLAAFVQSKVEPAA